MKARIGMVNFINTAPLYEIWKRQVSQPEWHVVEAPPTTLNRMLYNNELDLGFVSSHEYAAHPHLYRILDGLSISATGPVGSVFLFSRVSPEQLTGKTVQLSTQSQTSVSLVKIILEEFYQVQPDYISGDTDGQKLSNEISATLAIGDEALRLKQEGRFPVCLDLSELWQQHTDLPFVFALWAVRKEFCRNSPECVRQIHEELLSCVKQGKKELRPICSIVAPRIPMGVEACYQYLSGMEYDLGPQKVKALELFFDFLIKRGEAPTAALPVKICS